MVTNTAPRSLLVALMSGSENTPQQAKGRHVAKTRRNETARWAQGPGRGLAPASSDKDGIFWGTTEPLQAQPKLLLGERLCLQPLTSPTPQ